MRRLVASYALDALPPFLFPLAILLMAAPWDRLYADPPAAKPIVLPERALNVLVCAEYTSSAAPRQPNRSCVEAAKVRAWILANAPENQCH